MPLDSEPTVIPTWCTSNPAGPGPQPARVEPSSAKKASGFLHKEAPPRQDHNWLFWILCSWIDWTRQYITAIFQNFWAVITNAGISSDSSDLLTSDDVFDKALRARFGFWRVEGYEIKDWSQVSLTGTIEAHLTYTDGKCRSNDGKFGFSEEIQIMEGFVKKFRHDGGFTKGTGNFGSTVTLAADNWYHIFIVHFDDGTLDIAMDDNLTGTNIFALGGVLHVRRLSSHYFFNITSGFTEPVIQEGDEFKTIGIGGTVQLNSGAAASTDVNISTWGIIPPGVDASLVFDIIGPGAVGVYTGILEKWRTAVGTFPQANSHHFSENTLFNTRRKFFIPASNPVLTVYVSNSTSQTHYATKYAMIDKRVPWTT